jgi:hypothetical protein
MGKRLQLEAVGFGSSNERGEKLHEVQENFGQWHVYMTWLE